MVDNRLGGCGVRASCPATAYSDSMGCSALRSVLKVWGPNDRGEGGYSKKRRADETTLTD
jgi:hypothetical protein